MLPKNGIKAQAYKADSLFNLPDTDRKWGICSNEVDTSEKSSGNRPAGNPFYLSAVYDVISGCQGNRLSGADG